jgi:hypothetical protein
VNSARQWDVRASLAKNAALTHGASRFSGLGGWSWNPGKATQGLMHNGSGHAVVGFISGASKGWRPIAHPSHPWC